MADLRKSGLLEMHRGGDSFADLGGLENLKRFCARRASRPAGPAGPRPGRAPARAAGRGQVAVRQGGSGNETRAGPPLVLDLGARLGLARAVGGANSAGRLRFCRRDPGPASPSPTRSRRRLAAPSRAAASTAAVSPPGCSARCGLGWLSHRTSDSFFVFTANDVSRLPPEFIRAGRLNAVFFVDLPGPAERGRIWPIHLGRFGLDPSRRRPEDRDWSGAEIETCCRPPAAARPPPGRGGGEHRPRGRDRRRGGRAAPQLGRRALPVGRPTRPLQPRVGRRGQARPQRSPRPVVQLNRIDQSRPPSTRSQDPQSDPRRVDL